MPRHAFFLFPLILCTVLPASGPAQTLAPATASRGGGLLQTCNPTLQVDFTTAFSDGYGCQFTPQVTPGSNVVSNAQWDYYNYATGSWDTRYETAPQIAYFAAQPYPMCYTVMAYDMLASAPCAATACKLITPYAYAQCAGLQADFTIGSIDGGTITFTDLTEYPGGQVATATWSFGDGSSSVASASPTHTFTGSGPYEVCLTVVGEPPASCVASICKWLYLGPPGLPCAEVVVQGFALLQHENIVGVIDTSVTTGMNTRLDWDFGDGAVATGRIAAHAYPLGGSYQLCGTLKVWGPLLADTCVSTLCREVYPAAAISVGELPPARGPVAWPSPFTDALRVAGGPQPRRLMLHDGTGRLVYETWLPAGADPIDLELPGLACGPYVLAVESPAGRLTQLLTKAP